MIEPIFEGVRSHCLRHRDVLLAPGESECETCRILRTMKPPFSVKCIRGGNGVTKDQIYEVVWIVRDGSREHKDDMYGYVFKSNLSEKLALCANVFDPADFEFEVEEKTTKDTSDEMDWAMLG